MSVLIWLALLLPLALAGAVGWRREESLTRWAPVAASGGALACGLALVAGTTAGTAAPVTAGGLLRADSLSAFLLTVIGAVGVAATWGGLGEDDDPHGASYATLVTLFLAAMSLAVLADDLGVLWVAVEFTTIATAFLVGHRRSRAAVEAAWKYVILGSVGIAIAFLGIVLLYAATRTAGRPTLSWVLLSQGAVPGLDPDLVRAATALAVLGFATKAGLFPMHSWLPDAHGQAPAPVSGLMSGVLLAVAGYAVLRVRVIADSVIGPQFMRWLLIVGALGSLAIAGVLVLRQRDYKRLLAYSSIEHMGIIALGLAVGGSLATAAVLLHVLGHGLAKAGVFVLAGRILHRYGSTRIADVRGLLVTHPGIGRPFMAGMAALLGFPPFSLFFSEVGILLATWRAGLGWVALVAVGLILLVFVGLVQAVVAMSLGPAGEPGPGAGRAPAARTGPQAPILLALAVICIVPLVLDPEQGPIARAVHAVAGAG